MTEVETPARYKKSVRTLRWESFSVILSLPHRPRLALWKWECSSFPLCVGPHGENVPDLAHLHHPSFSDLSSPFFLGFQSPLQGILLLKPRIVHTGVGQPRHCPDRHTKDTGKAPTRRCSAQLHPINQQGGSPHLTHTNPTPMPHMQPLLENEWAILKNQQMLSSEHATNDSSLPGWGLRGAKKGENYRKQNCRYLLMDTVRVSIHPWSQCVGEEAGGRWALSESCILF